MLPRPPDASRALAVAVTVLVACLAAIGCGSDEAGETGGEVGAVATTTHVADLVRNVGGERVGVGEFLTAGTDPHDYEPRPSDALAVSEADVVFRSGGDLDEWLAGVIDNAGGEAEVVTLLDEVEAIEGEPHEEHGDSGDHEGEGGGEAEHADDDEHEAEGEHSDDPHWWQDPRNAIVAVETIADALAEADPEGEEAYRENAAEYVQRLERLDEEIARCMEQVPEAERKLVTTHDAYGYFAERYDVEIVGALIPSRSTQAQPSAGGTANLVSQIEEEGVNAIFPESPLNPELEQAVAGETGATVGDPLWADSLGPEGSGGATYVEALASDAEAMAEGFTGTEGFCRVAG